MGVGAANRPLLGQVRVRAKAIAPGQHSKQDSSRDRQGIDTNPLGKCRIM